MKTIKEHVWYFYTSYNEEGSERRGSEVYCATQFLAKKLAVGKGFSMGEPKDALVSEKVIEFNILECMSDFADLKEEQTLNSIKRKLTEDEFNFLSQLARQERL